MDSWGQSEMYNGLAAGTLPIGSIFVPGSCWDWYYGPDPGNGTVGPGSQYLGTSCTGTYIGTGGASAYYGGIVIGWQKMGQPCQGSPLSSGESVNASGNVNTFVTDIAPVQMITTISGTTVQAGQLLGWIYTTRGAGQYFQLGVTFSISGGALVQGGASMAQGPIVSFNGNYISAFNNALGALGFAGKALPPPFDGLASGKTKLNSHSCYHR